LSFALKLISSDSLLVLPRGIISMSNVHWSISFRSSNDKLKKVYCFL